MQFFAKLIKNIDLPLNKSIVFAKKNDGSEIIIEQEDIQTKTIENIEQSGSYVFVYNAKVNELLSTSAVLYYQAQKIIPVKGEYLSSHKALAFVNKKNPNIYDAFLLDIKNSKSLTTKYLPAELKIDALWATIDLLLENQSNDIDLKSTQMLMVFSSADTDQPLKLWFAKLNISDWINQKNSSEDIVKKLRLIDMPNNNNYPIEELLSKKVNIMVFQAIDIFVKNNSKALNDQSKVETFKNPGIFINSSSDNLSKYFISWMAFRDAGILYDAKEETNSAIYVALSGMTLNNAQIKKAA